MNTQRVQRLFLGVLLAWISPAAIALAQQIDTCGTLVSSITCLLFEVDSGTRYILVPRPSGLQAGDRVHVVGDLDPQCVSFCLQGNGCVHNPAVTPCTPTPTCRADFDVSGSLGVQDIFAFLAAYFSGGVGPSPPSGDFDENGQLSVGDIFAFLAAYFTGCP